ncbi:MAG: four helix bundle protein [Polyangiaceae bacterium]
MTHFNFQKTDAYLVAKQVAVLVHQARIRDVELRDQATRAAKSCFLNLSEGLPSRMAGVRRRHFAIALGSLGEVCAAIDLALAIGAVDPSADLDAALVRLAPLVGGLLRAG